MMTAGAHLPAKWRGDGAAILIRSILAFALAAVWACIAHGASRGLDVNRVTVPVAGLPDALDGLRIAQISDLHSSRYGENQSELADAIAAFEPDLIAITGDFTDGFNPDFAPCGELVRAAVAIAPVYWVRGNHEYYLDMDVRREFEEKMEEWGATLLDNRAVALERDGRRFLLAGLDDVQALVAEDPRGDVLGMADIVGMEYARESMEALNAVTPKGNFPLRLMLCHQPAYWQPWQEAGYDLALCGHLHGWMVRVPIIGGLLRQPSSYFPEEDAGLYDKQGLFVYISRGLANRLSVKNFRMNNKPELTLIEIAK